MKRKKNQSGVKQTYVHGLIPLEYTITGKNQQLRITGSDLFQKLLNREGLFPPVRFTILHDALPSYVWDALFMNGDVSCSNDRIVINEATLRMFLETQDYRYFNLSAMTEFEEAHQRALTDFDAFLWGIQK